MIAMAEKRTADLNGNNGGMFSLGSLRKVLPLFVQISLMDGRMTKSLMPKDSNYSMPKGYDKYNVLSIAIENAGSIVVTLDVQ